MPTRTPNIQALAIVASGTFNALAALWIFADAKARRADKPLFAALAVLLLGPLWLAFYMTDRPLRRDERRTGGFGWNWTQNFAIAWTAATAPWLAATAFSLTHRIATVATQPLNLPAMWLVPIVLALGTGYLIRRPDVVEPGGPAPGAAPIPLAAVSALAMLLTFALLTALFRTA